jgi:hypothetical protein
MKELLFSLSKEKGDFVMETFRSGGNGGQNQNKRNTGVRIIHPASGAKGEARDSRTQDENKKAAFRRLIDSKKFQTWHRIQCGIAIDGFDRVERQLEEWMRPENFLIEVKKDGKWTSASDGNW